MKKAFTLIELLVVIAIIAILAAILFPVFAQAKASAKGAASLSNDKQEALAVLMYTNDVDDMAVLDTAWGDGYPYSEAGVPLGPWQWLIQPYTKNVGILADPLAPTIAIPASWTAVGEGSLYQCYWGNEYGYDYTVFSPSYWGTGDGNMKYNGGNDMARFPISMTTPNRPADTVLLTAHTAPSEPGDGWYWGPGTIVSNYGSEPVDCDTVPPACVASWGSGSIINGFFGATNPTTGAYTGFNAPRRANVIVSTFADGHAKASSPGYLATGTNWLGDSTPESTVVITNINNYHWTSQ